MADSGVTVQAKKPSHLPRLVVVIDTEGPEACLIFVGGTYFAAVIRRFAHGVEAVLGEAVSLQDVAP